MASKKEKPDKERMGLVAERIWRGAELRIMEDVVRRIKKAGEITSTADYQINRLIEMGRSREEVERIIKESLDATWPEMFEMYDKVAEWEYVRNQEVYEQITDEFIAPEDNEWIIQLTEAIRKQTQDTMVNLSQSCGFSVMMGGRRVFTPFAEYYQKYVDTAIQDVVTGATDYNSAVRKVVTQMTNSGLRVVDYASGHTNRADVAARRAVLTGVNQITAQISEHNAEKLGTDQFEVSWHPCARPDHQTWQGKVFSKEELRTVCGYGSVTGLCGANCRHSFDPFIPGISERLYPDDWLEEQNKREAQTKEWNGKQLNAYEQTQQQRKMETAMRAQRQKIRLLEEAGADKDDIMLEKAKYQGQLNEYKQFSKKMGLVEQRERIYQDGLGRIAPVKTTYKFQNKAETSQMYRPIQRSQESIDVKIKEDFEVKTRKVLSYSGDVYISDNATIKPRALHQINKNTEEAIKQWGIPSDRKPKIVIVSPDEMPTAYGKYDAIQNTVFYIPQIADKKIVENQGDIEYHEMWHMKQAENFRSQKGKITKENLREYIQSACKDA
ncbi:phage minor capsid protein, partial [Waltera sp.]|uniref:phage minor capsid protein n=1 Tax=Waltera sp. TaxID=2815806 RepID=UPI003AB94218